MGNEMHVIENEFLKVAVSPHGAELCSIFDKEKQHEVVWQADPAYWNRTSPASGSITLTGFPAISLPPGSSTTAMQPPFTSGRRRTLPKARLPRNRAYPITHARRARAYEKRD